MKPQRPTTRMFFCRSILLSLATLVCGSLFAQVRPVIVERIDEGKLVQLQGNVPMALRGATDLGDVDASQPMGRALLVLKRSDEQEQDLQSYLQQVHQQSSPNFHKWLDPAAFGRRFGAADSDLEQVRGWLQSHGLSVAKVSAGKTTMEFSGTVGQVEEAFHASIHRYTAGGVTHYANATDPQIPAALASIVGGVTQLNDFRPVPQSHVLGQAVFNPKTHQGLPQWTYPLGTGNPTIYFLTPEDFATQYDAKSVYATGTNGTGQTIGIINESNIDISLVNAYRKLFGLPVNPPQVVIDGNDPGVNQYAIEAYLDVENAGAAAPGATVQLYVAGTYGLTGAALTFRSSARSMTMSPTCSASASARAKKTARPPTNSSIASGSRRPPRGRPFWFPRATAARSVVTGWA